MKQLRQLSLATVVVCLFTYNTFAGEMNCPLPDPTPTPTASAVLDLNGEADSEATGQNSTIDGESLNSNKNLSSDLWLNVLRIALQGSLTIF